MADKYSDNLTDLNNHGKSLFLVNLSDSKFRGWRRELLVEQLSSLEEKFVICTNCQGVMRDACTDKVCYVCSDKPSTQTADLSARNAINELAIECPLNDKGCLWTGTFSIIIDHIGQCSFIPVTCPNGCFDSCTNNKLLLPRGELESHLSNKCPMRNISCEYCDDFNKDNELNNHLQSCNDFPISCPKGCYDDDLQLRKIKRNSIQYHLSKECPNKEVDCPFSIHGCKVQLARNNLQFHLEESLVEHLKYLTATVSRKEIEIKDLTESSDQKDIQIKEISKKLDKYEKLMQTVIDRLDGLESSVQAKGSVANTYSTLNSQNISELKKTLKEKDVQISELRSSLTKHAQLFSKVSETIYPPEYTFEINGVKKNIQEYAEIYSPSFYAYFYNFEIRVSFGLFDKSYCSVLANLTKGCYDNYISWPFSGKKYIFTLICPKSSSNSDYSCPAIMSTVDEDIKQYYNRPFTRNGGWGLIHFISIDELSTGKYCIRDSIKIKLQVTE